jgi:hypothetical protein
VRTVSDKAVDVVGDGMQVCWIRRATQGKKGFVAEGRWDVEFFFGAGDKEEVYYCIEFGAIVVGGGGA